MIGIRVALFIGDGFCFDFGQMLVQKAKGVGASAYGPRDGESLYCRAITAAFNGAVAKHKVQIN